MQFSIPRMTAKDMLKLPAAERKRRLIQIAQGMSEEFRVNPELMEFAQQEEDWESVISNVWERESFIHSENY